MESAYAACTSKEKEKAEGDEVGHQDREEEEEGDKSDDEEWVVWLGGRLNGGRA